VISQGLEALHVLGEYWQPDESVRTELGELIHAAKDGQEVDAADRLTMMISDLVPGRLDELESPALVTSVPTTRAALAVHLPGLLAAALARAGVGELAPDLVHRARPTPRLRYSDPAARPQLVRAAGYSANPIEAGTTVVLVDDVVLTGTTMSHLASCLREAGAARVIGVAAARTRRC
jgi:predicted amidophosphoribosyltransferase